MFNIHRKRNSLFLSFIFKNCKVFGLIFCFLGYYITKSFFGAFLGFIFGGYVDQLNRAKKQTNQYGSGGRQNRSAEEIYQYYQSRTNRATDVPTILMALSAAVMKADGKVVVSELNYVKSFFRMQFGNQFSTEHLQKLKHYLDSDIPVTQICADVRLHLRPDSRLQIVHYLFGIAKADGLVSQNEMNVIQDLSNQMGIPTIDFESVKNMFYRNVNSDYKILEIEDTASDEEVKKAYRKMAIKYHPDKVSQMEEELQKGATERFIKIQEAYENIKKLRGIK